MQELNLQQAEEVGGGFLFVALLVFDVAMIAYDCYALAEASK